MVMDTIQGNQNRPIVRPSEQDRKKFEMACQSAMKTLSEVSRKWREKQASKSGSPKN